MSTKEHMLITNAIFITWENQRRSVELSRSLGIPIYIITPRIFRYNLRILRYLECTFHTLDILINEQPKLLFVQNPSLILAVVAVLFKKIFKYRLIVDRHSNFKLSQDNKKISFKIFNILSNYTIRNAELTIITNKFLLNFVEAIGGKGFILEDKIPAINKGSMILLNGDVNVTFISTFSHDEPIDEVINAANKLNPNWYIYITGKPNKHYMKMIHCGKIPKNVIFTDFLSENDYQSLLISSDIILVLTKHDHTLTCGAYEAVSIGKCLVISDSDCLRSYFNKGAVYVKCDPCSIADGIKFAAANKSELEKDISTFRKRIELDWAKKFDSLIENLKTFQQIY